MKFYTIGYGGRDPKAFLRLLKGKNVKIVVDVRLKPNRASMGSYVKAKFVNKGIQKLLSEGDIEYISLVELGNPFLEDKHNWRERYKELLAEEGEKLIKQLKEISTPFCLMCAEKKVEDCHRQYIAEYLVKEGHEVEHIV